MEALFGDEISFHNTQVFFNPHKRTQKPYWHRDMQYSPIPDERQAQELANMLSLHVRIPLVKETGLKLLPGTHKRWDTDLERDVRFERGGHQHSENLPGATTLHLEPGDVLIFNAQMIHRGIYNKDECRKALDLCLGRPHHLTTPFLDSENFPNEEELAEIKYPQWFQTALQTSKQAQSSL
jgi:ectoine hydroxylase-related dioxygenase (phytanoyl-CoA dioxygenase family)